MGEAFVTREYQVCLKCHSNNAYGGTPPQLGRLGGTPTGTNNLTRYTNQAREFQPPAAHVGGGIGDVKNLGSSAGAGSNYNTGNHRSQPSLYQTASGKPRIQSALARSAVSLELNHRTMVRLGLYAAQHSAGLRGLVTAPGAL